MGYNCTLALYYQMSFVLYTNDATGTNCLDFMTLAGSCSGSIQGGSAVTLTSVYLP